MQMAAVALPASLFCCFCLSQSPSPSLSLSLCCSLTLPAPLSLSHTPPTSESIYLPTYASLSLSLPAYLPVSLALSISLAVSVPSQGLMDQDSIRIQSWESSPGPGPFSPTTACAHCKEKPPNMGDSTLAPRVPK